jgi:hypothetical protein
MKAALLWPLWSPKRLGLTIAGIVVVLGLLGSCAGTGAPKKASSAPSSALGAATGISPGGAPLDDHWTRVAGPTPSPVDHSADEVAANRFVAAWSSHTPAAVWLPAVQALSTPKLAAGFVGVDPSTVKATHATAQGTWTPLGVVVPTDAGSVLVVVTPAGLIDDITPAGSTSPPIVASGK